MMGNWVESGAFLLDYSFSTFATDSDTNNRKIPKHTIEY